MRSEPQAREMTWAREWSVLCTRGCHAAPQRAKVPVTLARQVIAGRTYLITRRCTQRQFLLRPDPVVEQIYMYCLGEAVERYGLTLHGFVAMSNHQHLVVRDNRGNLPEFLGHFHKMVAKVMNSRLGRWENFWATEQPNAVYLVEAADRLAKLVYTLVNPVAGHLVERVRDWPGASSSRLMTGKGLLVKRPRGFFREDGNMPPEITLRIERPDGFDELDDAQWDAKLAAAIREVEEQTRHARLRAGRRVLGRRAVLSTSPTDAPETLTRRGDVRPCIACRDAILFVTELKALVAFRFARAAALAKYLAKQANVLFPFGTYRVRGIFTTVPATSAVAACT